MGTIGTLAIFFALVIAVYTTLAAWFGARRNWPELVASARHGIIAYTGLATIAVIAIVFALLTHDLSLALVANSTSRDLQTRYTITALWSNQAGSLLFWSWILSLYSLIVVARKWERDRELMPYFVATIMALQTFFAFMLAFVSNPFERWWQVPGAAPVMALFPPSGASLFVPPDGNGLNPLLQHPAMALHPPMLYLGYVGFTIPFAFAMAALLSRRVGPAWIQTTRRYTLAPWLFLSMGLLLGGRWAYDVLGWGGYWGWDPVENADFMPWLTGTAFLHSVMVQERKGMLKVWNMGLIIITFSLVLFGTFLTRSGVIESVHSFATSNIGIWFLSFIAIVTLGATALLFTRLQDLRGEHEIDSLLSREAFFLLNNLLFVGAAFAILWGTIYPMFSELVYNQKLTVGAPYFNRIAAPIFGALLLIMAIIPLIGWGRASGTRLAHKLVRPLIIAGLTTAGAFALGIREPVALAGYALALLVIVATAGEIIDGTRARSRATRENWIAAFRGILDRNRQRYGGYLIHIGVAVLAIGIIGSQVYTKDETRALKPGESMQIGAYTLLFENISPNFPRGEATVTSAAIQVLRDGQRVATLSPERTFFTRQQQTETIPAIHSDLQQDLYVIIAGWEPDFATVTFRAYLNPLVFWVWFGGLLMVISTLIAAWPASPQPARVRVEKLTGEAQSA